MLSGLTERLVSAKAVAEAVRAYHQEMNRRNHERRAQTDADRLAIPKIERAINGIMTAIEDGMYQPAMKARRPSSSGGKPRSRRVCATPLPTYRT